MLPKGTVLECVAHYDNSSANKRNPDPTKPVRFGEASTNEMMFGMFEFTAADGVSPKPSTDKSRMAALMESFPKDTAFVADLPFGPRPTRLALHLPKTGDRGEWYIPQQLGIFTPMAVQEVHWDGPNFSFVSLMLVGGPGRGYYDVTGMLDADGSIHGRLTRRDAAATPPYYDF